MTETQYIAKLQRLDTQGLVKEAKRLCKSLSREAGYDPEAYDDYAKLDTLIEQADLRGCYETLLAEFDRQGYNFGI
jgi:hypothetical protein